MGNEAPGDDSRRESQPVPGAVNISGEQARIIVTIVALLLAALNHYSEVKLDSTSIVLIVIAFLPWVMPFLAAHLKSFELFGVGKFELLERQVQENKKTMELIEQNAALPGRKVIPPGMPPASEAPPDRDGQGSQASVAEETPKSDARAGRADPWNEDPNSGKFGGSPKNNGQILEADIKPAINEDSAACEIRLRVRSTDPGKPLTGKVKFHLHPTFGRSSEDEASVKDGVAKITITSWGVFTVGAEADQGHTRLELNLREVQGGTDKFYRN